MTATPAITLITAIGPTACYVLLLLVAVGQPVSQRWIQAIGKLDDRTVAKAVIVLTEHRLAARVTRYAIQATQRARQLVLGESDIIRLGVGKNPTPAAPLEEEEEPPIYLDINPPPQPGVGENPTPPPQPIHSPPVRANPSVRPDILAALDAAGIADPARSRLATLPHVTPDLVRAHVASAPNLSLAIYRIEHNWKLLPAERADTEGYRRRYRLDD